MTRLWRIANPRKVAQQNLRYRQKHKAEINAKRRAKAYEQSRSGVASKAP
jgi:hypothetical protein